jgi:hypothetical protein
MQAKSMAMAMAMAMAYSYVRLCYSKPTVTPIVISADVIQEFRPPRSCHCEKTSVLQIGLWKEQKVFLREHLHAPPYVFTHPATDSVYLCIFIKQVQ